jgi:hypothetical protein
MAYVGNKPAVAYSTVSYQDLTGGTGTGFTLDYPAGSAQDIEVFVNNVRQEPGVAYTVSNTSLTMTGSIVATDDFYVVFQSKAQQTLTPGLGTITQAMLSPTLSLGAGYFQGENGATGDTTNGKGDIFRVHEQQLDTNVTIGATDNALCAGPLTIATGVTLTVTTGGNLVIA